MQRQQDCQRTHGSARMHRALLVVEPYESFRSQLVLIADEAGWEAIACETFALARRMVTDRESQLVVSNVRLGQFNGIQLAYLAKLATPSATVIVYASEKDMSLAHDAQEAAAFFERQSVMPYALPSYLKAQRALPERDRRDPVRPDRRSTFRGGRRATDLSFLHGSYVASVQRPRWPKGI